MSRVASSPSRQSAVGDLGTSYEALDFRFAVTCDEPILGSRLAALFRPVQRAAAEALQAARQDIAIRRNGGGFSIEIDGILDPGIRTAGEVLDHLQWHVNSQVIDRVSQRGTGFHAAALQRDGVTLLCPAESGSGKSTLAAALVRDGWTYLSDEAVEIDPAAGQLVPYPKAITLDPGAQHLFPEVRPEVADTQSWYADPDAWGPRAAYVPSAPTVVLLPRFALGGGLLVDSLAAGPALLALAQSTFHFRRGPERNLRRLGRMVRTTPVYSLRYESLDLALEGVRRVLDEVGS